MYTSDKYIVHTTRREEQEQEEKEDLVGYLAQHCLFQQINELQSDIIIPDYCSLLTQEDEDANSEDIIVNAWLVIDSCDIIPITCIYVYTCNGNNIT